MIYIPITIIAIIGWSLFWLSRKDYVRQEKIQNRLMQILEDCLQSNTRNIENLLQLHEVVEIHYCVDHYSVQFYTQDGDKRIFEIQGKTIDDALASLDSFIKGYTLEQIRKL